MAAGDPIGAACREILAAFPGEIAGLYLLGSRAIGREDAASDLDLGIVFRGEAPAERRRAAGERVAALGRRGPVPIDVTILDEVEARRGIRPLWTLGRLLAGDDVLRGCPLRPLPELRIYYAHLAVYFPWAIRGRPASLRFPLARPGDGEFLGYDRQGIRTGPDAYRPGFKMLANVVLSIANFRLAQGPGVPVASKHFTAAAYAQSLPEDPWLDLVMQVDSLCRIRWQGRVPEDPEDRSALAGCCCRVADFENEAVGACLLLLPQFAAAEDPDLRQRLRGMVGRVRSDSPAHAAAIAEARAKL